MNKRQRIADKEMLYLGRAWRNGYCGPHRDPSSLKEPSNNPAPFFDDEKVLRLHERWVVVDQRDHFYGLILKVYYERVMDDDDDYQEEQWLKMGEDVLAALDLFSKA